MVTLTLDNWNVTTYETPVPHFWQSSPSGGIDEVTKCLCLMVTNIIVMNDSKSLDGPETEQAFQEALVELIHAAHANGVDIEGGWADRNEHPELPDWGIEIYELV